MLKSFYILFLFLLLMLFGCGDATTLPERQTQQFIANQIFSTTVTQLNFHVFYEDGAAPYDGKIGLTTDDTWDITKDSFEALFSAHNRSIIVPNSLSGMSKINDQAKSNWTSTELINLGLSLAPKIGAGASRNIAVFFLNGNYTSPNILGVHFSGYNFCFVFKDVVQSVGGSATNQKYAEQAVVVHELGHTVGLVNLGVPMVVDHEDKGHRGHTTNTDGVMYWSVERRDQISGFLSGVISSGNLNLFETQSLNDGQSFKK